MYLGIKRKHKKEQNDKINNKYQVLQMEKIEANGTITNQMVFKTKKYERDESISWKDFEIGNLMAAGINPKTLPNTILQADIETLTTKASKSELLLDELETIKAYENETATEQTQQ